jgi:hypothetical protein
VAPPWLYFGAVPDAGYQRLIVFIEVISTR